jgi:tRNA(fMet)-specific endonuclease VapC
MPAFALDTDTFSLFLKGHPHVCENVLGRPLEQTTTTIITVEEELGGWYSVLRKTKDHTALARAYLRMTETVEALARFQLLTFTEPAMGRFEALRKLHPRIGRNDLRIAAIVLENQLSLVTRNRLDFEQIEGLSIVDWAA